jgi:hypothetical protein
VLAQNVRFNGTEGVRLSPWVASSRFVSLVPHDANSAENLFVEMDILMSVPCTWYDLRWLSTLCENLK